MQINLFQWIREGVRHSVLAGVADAVDQLGETPHHDNLSARLGDYLRAQDDTAQPKLGHDTRPKKRLGRSLRELSPTLGNTTNPGKNGGNDQG